MANDQIFSVTTFKLSFNAYRSDSASLKQGW